MLFITVIFICLKVILAGISNAFSPIIVAVSTVYFIHLFVFMDPTVNWACKGSRCALLKRIIPKPCPLPTRPVEKLSSMKPIPGAKKGRDCWFNLKGIRLEVKHKLWWFYISTLLLILHSPVPPQKINVGQVFHNCLFIINSKYLLHFFTGKTFLQHIVVGWGCNTKIALLSIHHPLRPT